MVFKIEPYVNILSFFTSQEARIAVAPTQKHGQSSSKVTANGLCIVRESFEDMAFSPTAVKLVMSSWRDTTVKQYESYISRWIQYCSERNINTLSPNVTDVVNFLAHCFDMGLGYSALNTARSALSTFIMVDKCPAGAHPHVVRLMRGVFTSRPALPRNNVIWDTSLLLNYLKKLSPVKKLNLLQLSKKAVTLTILLTGQRTQSLHLIDIRNITINKSKVTFRFGDLLKQSRPGHHIGEITVTAYAPDMNMAGIDMEKFTPHSTRSAASSQAKLAKVPLDTILKTAGWSKDCTFAKYYDKEITQQGQFADAILSGTGAHV
ncbi:uncharacterized protein LOC106171928 [Lingula anatina]|uniref:Uncharacterized protein LOC106162935 n=1 Tax=Lingula anatina TaxID=7574 RepID=A0A1S3ID94_LINAN|nr:uncharacterized protein LOC106162935 [Lingula anatina]XP_013407913.1 uncharacterized protein LOC106171928 [Lingula anatina]|eukprot:XP_013395831.1 uncharacterized protein LOC106162935 [Lingula anatina]